MLGLENTAFKQAYNSDQKQTFCWNEGKNTIVANVLSLACLRTKFDTDYSRNTYTFSINRSNNKLAKWYNWSSVLHRRSYSVGSSPTEELKNSNWGLFVLGVDWSVQRKRFTNGTAINLPLMQHSLLREARWPISIQVANKHLLLCCACKQVFRRRPIEGSTKLFV